MNTEQEPKGTDSSAEIDRSSARYEHRKDEEEPTMTDIVNQRFKIAERDDYHLPNKEMYILNSEDAKELMGVFDNHFMATKIAVFREHMLTDPGYFGRNEKSVRNLSEEQILEVMVENKKKANELARGDDRCLEAFYLREILKGAKGNLNHNEKLMIFNRLDDDIVKNPALLEKLQEKLWNVREGKKIDDEAIKIIKDDGFAENREKHVEEKVKAYRTEKLVEVLGIEQSQIDGRIKAEKEKEGGREISDSEAKSLIIEEKREEIKKRADFISLSDEGIMALSKMGYDLAKMESPRGISGIFRDFKKKDGEEVPRGIVELDVREGLLAVADDLSSYAKKEGENWDTEFKKTKKKIIKDALEEIPEASAIRIYEEQKMARFFNSEIEGKIKEKKERGQTCSETFSGGFEDLGKAVANILGCKNLEDFQKITEGFQSEDLKKFAAERGPELVNKIKEGKEGGNLFWFEILFLLIAGLLSSQKSLEEKNKKQ